jgi:pimeloyl-ACP methyl ester carboxylesterase
MDGQPIGTAKIIFVAHSMGGLVVKKAFLLGKQDDQFADIVANVHGVIFLATPHRGAQHATTLNNILASTPLGPPPKAYVNDLGLQSNALQEINEQFRHCCDKLSLVSFFETLKTSFGMTKAIVSITFSMNSILLGMRNAGLNARFPSSRARSSITTRPDRFLHPSRREIKTSCKYQSREKGRTGSSAAYRCSSAFMVDISC